MDNVAVVKTAFIITKALQSVYCDTCNEELNTDVCDVCNVCDECHRKNMNWSISEKYAVKIARDIIAELEGE